MLQPKQYQVDFLEAIRERRRQNNEPVLAVGPCGSGKSLLMEMMARFEYEAGGQTLVLAHRQLLVDQLAADYEESGIPYTVIAEGYGKPDLSQPVIVASLQMLYSRVVQRAKLEMPTPTLVLVDEAHNQTGNMFRSVIFGSKSSTTSQAGVFTKGAYVVGFTATPLFAAKSRSVYTHLEEIASYSLLRKERMHQVIRCYGPNEVDTASLGSVNTSGEYSEKKVEEYAQNLFGSAFDEYYKLNEQQRPAILFAPSVATSKWFAHEFTRQGVPFAHVDGSHCLLPNGKGGLDKFDSGRSVRQDMLQAHREGDIKGIANRFVLREAINLPWAYHAIIVTVPGLANYLQMVGRLQRFWPEYESKIMQEHGGLFWRWGSPNINRDWRLNQTHLDAAYARMEALRAGETPEPIRCPKCSGYRNAGKSCPHCGYVSGSNLVRRVITKSGRLKKNEEIPWKQPVEQTAKRSQQLWRSCLYGAARRQATVKSTYKVYLGRCRGEGLGRPPSSFLDPPLPAKGHHDWQLPVGRVWPQFLPKQRS